MVEHFDDPENTAGMTFLPGDIDRIVVGSWGPKPNGEPPQTQVHLRIYVEGSNVPIIMRFKGPRTLDRVIGSLLDFRNEVWPESRKEKRRGK